MPDVLITRSETHPVEVDRVRRELEGYAVETVSLPPGGLHVGSEDDLIDALSDHRALLLRPGRATRRLFEEAPDLSIVAIHGSGYDHVDVGAATEHGVVVTHSPEAPAPAVVEHTFGTIFTLLRDFPGLYEATNRGEWDDARRNMPELGRRTLGVVGLGTIGFDVARTAATAFGATVLGYDPYVTGDRSSPIFPRHDPDEIEAAGIEVVPDLDAFLDAADVVTLHPPLTDETAGLIGAAELDRLAGGYLVNMARGGIVDEAALLGAVEAGTLAGVATDVLEHEPPDPTDPILTSPRVLVTPHIAGVSDGYFDRAARVASAKIRTRLEGGRPEFALNPEVLEA